MLMSIIVWVLLGLVIGALAKWIMPGADGGGYLMTILLGIGGAIVGGYVSALVGMGEAAGGISIISVVFALVGALILLTIYRLVVGRSLKG